MHDRSICVFISVCFFALVIFTVNEYFPFFSKSVHIGVSLSVVSDSLQPHRLQPIRLLCPGEYWSELPPPSPYAHIMTTLFSNKNVKVFIYYLKSRYNSPI